MLPPSLPTCALLLPAPIGIFLRDPFLGRRPHVVWGRGGDT
jgi:hypothetical protein